MDLTDRLTEPFRNVLAYWNIELGELAVRVIVIYAVVVLVQIVVIVALAIYFGRFVLYGLFSDAADRIRSHAYGPFHVRSYRLSEKIVSGVGSNVFFAVDEKSHFVVRISHRQPYNSRLANEVQVLSQLSGSRRGSIYNKYLPHLVESFVDRGRQTNVFDHRPGFFSAAQILDQYPNGLDGRHLAWMFNRMLEILGYVHEKGFVHGAVVPSHLLFQVRQHGLQLSGWDHAIPLGSQLQTVSHSFQSWYPNENRQMRGATASSDLYLAAKSIVFLAGGDPNRKLIPQHVPKPMRRFLSSCMLESEAMRPQNAWDLHEEFMDLLEELYGIPKFYHLEMSF